jgi:hypothetical protein
LDDVCVSNFTRGTADAITSSDHSVSPTDNGCHEHTEQSKTNNNGKAPLPAQRVGAKIFGSVNTQQHDNEKEQHNNCTGVHDYLHRGQELCVLGHEEHGDAKQSEHQTQCGMHRIAPHDHTDRTTDHHDGGTNKDE